MTTFKAIAKDKETKEISTIESDYNTKSEFIKDLRANGYSVNPDKVKESSKFDYIINHTNCEVWDWKEITEEKYYGI